MTGTEYATLLAQIKRHEGAVRDADGNHTVYRCPAGVLTIGYGHNLESAPVPGAGPTLSQDQADRLLAADVLAAQEKIALHLPWAERMDPPRYAVLVNMAFNLGVGGLLAFKNTLAAARKGEYAEAAAHMLRSRWAAQVGGRAKELAAQMRSGTWQ